MEFMVEAQPVLRRVAFFGGSFDPPHLGHLAVARAARDALRLDLVLFAPVGAQPLKPAGSSASFADRMAMTELALEGERGMQVSAIDAPDDAGKPNYTLHSLRRLRDEKPDIELFCLMGADSFLSLRHWYGAADVPFAASLVVASRPGQSLQDLAASLPTGIEAGRVGESVRSADPGIELLALSLRNQAGQRAMFYLLPGLDVEISATEIRTQVRAGSPASKPLVPPAVARYIREHTLYQ